MIQGIIRKYSIIYDKKYRYVSTFLCGCLLASVALQVIYPKYLEKLLNSLDKDKTVITSLAVNMMTICMLMALCSFISDFISNYLFIELSISLKNRLIEKIYTMDFQENQEFEMGEITQTYVNDVDSVIAYIANVLIALVINVLTVIGILAISVITDYHIGIIMVVISVFAFYLLRHVNNYAAPFWTEQRKDMENFYSYIYEVIGLIKELKFTKCSPYIWTRFSKAYEKISESNLLAGIMGYHLWVASIICFSLTKWIVVLVGGILVYKGVLTMAEVFLFTYYLDKMTSTIEGLRVNLQSVQISNASLERVQRVMNFSNRMCYGTKELDEITQITFENVYFSYKNKRLLQDFSICFVNNQICALIGASGVGKTTVVKLLCRIYDVQKGKILFDGKSIREFKKETLTESIEYITQSILVEGLSLRETLRLDSKEKRILFKHYLAMFELDEAKINIDESMGNIKEKISHGDYQTLYAIKTLLSEKKILLLDEITSHIDNARENIYFQELQKIKKQRIIIFITHKESTINHCDYIVEIKRNKKNE